MFPLGISGMGVAIHLDNKMLLRAGKIRNVWADRMLLAKVKIVCLVSPQTGPEDKFGIGHALS